MGSLNNLQKNMSAHISYVYIHTHIYIYTHNLHTYLHVCVCVCGSVCVCVFRRGGCFFGSRLNPEPKSDIGYTRTPRALS